MITFRIVAVAALVASMVAGGATAAESFKGHMLSKNPSKTAQILLSDFESGGRTKDIYTNPFVVKHNYETFEKYTYLDRPSGSAGGAGPRWKATKLERLIVLDGGGAITVLMTHRITTQDGREFVHDSASVSFVNDEGKIYRQEAYYDPHEQQVDAFTREHLKMYGGVVPKK